MIRVGIGGWSFDPWRETFYPPNVSKARELEYASRAVTSIEINSTFYSSQKPETFRKWAAATPDGFQFAVKASRMSVIRKNLADGAESVERFLNQGITELGDKLGPILWQLAGTKKYSADDIEGFLDLLPDEIGGIKLRHALEARHETFKTPDFVAQVRKRKNVAIVYADSDDYLELADLNADFVYARLQRSQADEATGYAKKDITRWTSIAQQWEKGEAPDKLPYAGPPAKARKSRDVFVYFISGAKERNPAAAVAMIEALNKKR